MKKLEVQKLFWVSLIFNVLLFIGVVGLWYQNSSSPSIEAKPRAFKANESNFEEYFIKANRAFFDKNYKEALTWYQNIDNLSSDSSIWHTRAKNFLTSQRILKSNLDSLQYILNVTYTGSIEKEEALIKLQEEILQKNLKIDTLSEKLDETSTALHYIEEANQTLSSRLSEASNKYQVLDFENEEHKSIRYYGEVTEGKANGFGIGIFETGGIYEGNWKNNMPHGRGKYEWKNEDVYQGNYVEGKREGYGVYTFASKVRYEGDWKENLRHGKGKMYSPEGKLLLDGDWRKDKFKKEKKKK